MRHRRPQVQLGRKSSHRKAMIRNLLTSLVDHERLETTHTRCMMLKSEMDKLITLGKKNDLHAKRLVARILFRKDLITKLFDEIAPRYAGRQGGYTRVMRRGVRIGDAGESSIIELLPVEGATAAPEKPASEPAATSEE